MALQLADLALTRTRLFADPEALTRARRLIDLHGYRRRLPELAAAEAEVLGRKRERWMRFAYPPQPGAAGSGTKNLL